MRRVESISDLYDYMPLEMINVGLRSELAANPEEYGFKIHSTHEFSKGEWDYYTIARSYVPGIITYTRNSLSRKEAEHLFTEYNKRGLLSRNGVEFRLYEHRLDWMKKLN